MGNRRGTDELREASSDGDFRSMLSPSLLLLMALQQPGAAQGSLEGTVRDATTGRPVAGASLLLADLDWGVLTDANGAYILSQVPPGPQHLTVSALGYAERTIHALVPRADRLRLDVSLDPRPFPLRGLEVSAPSVYSGVPGAVGTVLREREAALPAIRQDPTLAEPDPFLALTGGEVFTAPETSSGVHLWGGAAEHTGYLLDGIPVLNPFHAGGFFSAWNPDALAEIGVSSIVPSPTLPSALSGIVAGRTRSPGPRFAARGALSTAQGRITVDGPVGVHGIGYLASWRTGFPSPLGGSRESSYLRGETADLLLKLTVPSLLGGELGVLFYDNDNELTAAREAPRQSDAPTPDPLPRHGFAWRSESAGATWSRTRGSMEIVLALWRARSHALSQWQLASVPTALGSDHRDLGLQAIVRQEGSGSATQLGWRVQRIRASYDLRTGEGGGSDAEGASIPADEFGAPRSTLESTITIERTDEIGATFATRGGAALTFFGGRIYFAPRAGVEWQATGSVSIGFGYSRGVQFTQSAANPESPVRTIFPTELTVVAGRAGVPVPRSDLGVLGVEWHPAPGVALGARGFVRGMDDLLLVALGEEGPFAQDGAPVGSGRASGLTVNASAMGARYVAKASYAWQRVELETSDAELLPSYSSRQRVEAGLGVFPSPTLSLRVSVSGGFGRRGTAIAGAFEWEACNLMDEGCEFAGTPLLAGEIGGLSLPDYLRVDLGVRKHWHLRIAGRDTLISTFGTLTNLLGRRNVLAYTIDGQTGTKTAVEMLPFSPLVIGVDWEF
ncbi:MAG: carboxypeptidase-like regulatory domain-containing protein [Gemmatimonadota bacterium]